MQLMPAINNRLNDENNHEIIDIISQLIMYIFKSWTYNIGIWRLNIINYIQMVIMNV